MKRLKKFLNNSFLRPVFILTNWFFQGIPQSDSTEKYYKIGFTIIFTFIFQIMVSTYVSGFVSSLLLGFLLAHTLNWLVNCNLSVIFIHRIKWMKTDPNKLMNYLTSIQSNLVAKNWYVYVVSSGGICRGTLNKHSDLDVNVVRKPGFINAARSILSSIYEKKRADFNGIPLDFIVSDSAFDCKQKTGEYENPIRLADPSDLVKKYYANSITIMQAKTLNNL